ncbi:hypothetical protein [Streptomyces wuyuanensis]|uniref:hypothetical protein n=1 Tax=Streptomyces wuyuanensis TaxID=1196353 RepID=UPI00378EC4D7
MEFLQAEHREAEAAWERFVIARETVGQVLAEPRDRELAPVANAASVRAEPVLPKPAK